jgi:hypothetical protein
MALRTVIIALVTMKCLTFIIEMECGNGAV